jgi:hypothetical protein
VLATNQSDRFNQLDKLDTAILGAVNQFTLSIFVKLSSTECLFAATAELGSNPVPAANAIQIFEISALRKFLSAQVY